MKNPICSLRCMFLFVAVGIISLLPLQAKEGLPDVDTLLENVRRLVTMQKNQDFQGSIDTRRRDRANVNVPFNIGARGEVLCFQYLLNNQWERFDLHFKNRNQEIQYLKNGKMAVLPKVMYAALLADTDVTYEDLSMRFLYWPGGEVLNESDSVAKVKGRLCWVVQLKNPSPSVGQYAWVRVWIDRENGGFCQIDGIDGRGEVAKRFLVAEVMKLKNGSWFFKTIKVELLDKEDSRKVTGMNYIRMNAAK